MTSNIQIDMGQPFGINGIEINFWIKPMSTDYSLNSTAQFFILMNSIMLNYVVTRTSSNDLVESI
jgi:hypothetical protein